MYCPHLNFYYKDERSQSTVVDPHSHNCYEIVYFTKTNCNLWLGQKQYHLKSGDLYIVYPNTVHSETHFEHGSVLFLGFELDNFPKDSIFETVYHIRDHNKISTLMELVITEAAKQEQNYDEMISHLLSEILIFIQRHTMNNTQSTRSVDFAYNYICEYYAQDIDLHQLASNSGYSPDHFRHIFTERYGASPKQLQINMRIDKAAELLQNSSTSCTDIAELCGFSTSAQFTKMFKERYNTTPKQFQQRNKKQ